MIKEAEKDFGKYIIIGIISVLIFLSYKIVASYLIILISAFIFAYMSKPMYNWLKEKIPSGLSAFICMFVVFVIFIVPISLVLIQVGAQTYNSINDGSFTNFISEVVSLPILDSLKLDITALAQKAMAFIFSLLKDLVIKIPAIAISTTIFLFAFYYILVDWEILSDFLKKFLPFENKAKTLIEIDNSTREILFGNFFVAIIKFIVAAIGFYLAGVPLYLFWAFIIAIVSFIPAIGSPVIFIPMLVYYGFIGNWYSFIIVLVTTIVTIVFLDIIWTAKFVGKKSKIHPFIMILGIIGGTAIFGLFGFVIGPLILIYTIKLTEIVLNNAQQH